MKKLDSESMAALPGPGEVDFLCGGPPCQGYSGMNRFNKGEPPVIGPRGSAVGTKYIALVPSAARWHLVLSFA